MTNVIAIVGVGPGLGASIARRFAKEGFAVALLARDTKHTDPVVKEIAAHGGQAAGFAMDATQVGSVTDGFHAVREKLGDPTVFVYNAGAFVRGGILELDAGEFEQAWRANCLGALLCAQQVLPAMLERGQGTILLSGATASLRGSANFAGLAVGKFGLRALAQSMARELGPQGIHVAHFVIDGQIDNPRTRSRTPAERAQHTFLRPDAIAETYWQTRAQDPSAWALEIDLRPAVEKF
jgi:NAD(P)-dependent dehydrogenase (short-subunit alcohol dehydrogenase family)